MQIRARTKFVAYFDDWIETYKKSLVRPVTFKKYLFISKQLHQMVPDELLGEIDYGFIQELMNIYGKGHELPTLKAFYQAVHASLLDAIDAKVVDPGVFRHVVLHGRRGRQKTLKYLNLIEVKRLIHELNLSDPMSMDWIYWLVAKTGLRVSEVLGLTESDFDFEANKLMVWRTWNYKVGYGFDMTKNDASRRVILLDPLTLDMVKQMISDRRSKDSSWDSELPIFVQHKRVYLSTLNYHLKQLCKAAGIKTISMHGLRHTHASLLIYDGVSLQSVAKRLGHANTVTTQNTYVHLVEELARLDELKIVENMVKLS